MVHNDIVGTVALMAFCAFTTVINLPLSLGFMAGALLDESFFTYGMIGCGVCGVVVLACVLPWVILDIVELAKEPARQQAKKEWLEHLKWQSEEERRHVDNIW